MTATTANDGHVDVDVCYTHYGHEHELQHIRISKIKRREIALKIREGISRDRVLDEIRESVADDLHRQHLVDKKDLCNISTAYGLDNIRRHGNDQQSVLAWIKEWEENEETNPILFHKLQGEEAPDGVNLANEDFFIAVQTPLQKHMFQKFASNGVCCDTTHGTNAYDFSLATILVADEFGKGFPAGWCISNHEDFTVMHLFFSMIRKNCGVQHSGFFMSDMAPQFFNAWVGVMGEPRPKKLVCTWHVDKAWRTELKKKIGETAVEAEVYKMLRMVLEQTNTSLFQDCVDALLLDLSSDKKKKDFRDYFKQEWLPNKEHWAFCYRLGLGINTNMFVEAFHRVFKRNYLGGKVNKRVDVCLLNLLKFARDQCFGRMIQLTKGKASYRVKAIQERHRRSLGLPLEKVVHANENAWNVESSDGKNIYEVQRLRDKCPETKCHLSCIECGICIHCFVCTCPDSLILHTICKHIHLVQRALSFAKDNSIDCEDCDFVDDLVDNCNSEEIQRLTCFAQMPNVADVENIRARVKSRIADMLAAVEKSANPANMLQLEKSLNSSYSLFLATEEDGSSPQSLSPTNNAPVNKNMETQPRFVSTKRKRDRVRNVRFVKPSREEKEDIMEKYRELSK
jgi:hypothetical protein